MRTPERKLQFKCKGNKESDLAHVPEQMVVPGTGKHDEELKGLRRKGFGFVRPSALIKLKRC
jgi:hypothetical protein